MADSQFSGKLIGVIGDEDTVTGFLLAGVGERTSAGTNFLVVKKETRPAEVLQKFKELTEREDVAIILINQHIANLIRQELAKYTKLVPTVLEIPSKEHPYDPTKDQVLKQVNLLLGGE
ncbi:V-type proton ATPase subunit F [Hondaea fermentalgiana]|uniref:V-type proton ATPase subunit F n=1 Tax=Hondaea fermentalgiana TaxID=2315210 RepID=A0A2R5GJK4_9STRA|nr:V-type proton ATPase subunit F [Hondaea fermentalgiana]|eukprot:GBG30805.1 V-type proton ATPase subunit F [Hondaea fermentalgiana]